MPLGGGRSPVRKDASSLVFDILLDNCRGYFPDTTGKVSIGPEYPFLPIVFGQERPESLPKMMCRFLFYCLDNVTDGICRVVSEKDMHVVFVCFHRHDFVVMSISDALNLLFYGINP